MKRSIATLVCAALSLHGYAQQNDASEQDMYELSLEELMNIPIHSASKKAETVFDAPLSSYTLTRAEIERSGSTTIMEALRLVPGLIVREQSNGVYDIHIRGFDNILRNSQAFTKNNLVTLVMIDSRPAFNHNLGGTFWEALPVDVHDVERIEIVRGPSAPLFGPNAVTGVVNIITRRPESTKTVVSASLEAGHPSTIIANAYVGKKLNARWSTAASFNMQDRSRFDNELFNNQTGLYADGGSFIPNYSDAFPHPERSMHKTGINGYITYENTTNTKVDVSLGYQDNESLRNMIGSHRTILNYTASSSFHTNVSARFSNLNFRTSYLSGKDNILYGGSPSSYDYQVADVNAEYTIRMTDKIIVVPGVNYQNATFNDKDYMSEGGEAFLNGTEQSISTISGFLRSDINFTPKWRLIAALRADKFTSPDDVYLAYEFASTYKVDDKNLVRVAVTRSNSGAFIGYNKVDVHSKDEFHLAGPIYLDQLQKGNENLDLLTVNMIELGYRTRVTNNFHVDVDLFHQQIQHLTTLIVKGFTQYPPTPASDFLVEFDNVPTTARQLGATVSVNFVHGNKFQFKPFLTLQHTETKDLPNSFFDPTLNSRQPNFPEVAYSDSKHAYTPAVFGGYYLNVKPTEKLNVNMSGYYMASQTWYRAGNVEVDSGSSFNLNLKASYQVTRWLSVYANGRNVLDETKTQFLGADRRGALYLAGLSLNVK